MSLPEITSTRCIQQLIERALGEDIGPGDVTSESLVGEGEQATARIVARGACTLSGVPIARSVFAHVDPELRTTAVCADGKQMGPGDVVMEIGGAARSVLEGERVALNFLQHMTGIATLTQQFVDRARPHGVDILDTRKTTPGMRILEKYAVRCGGGRNHRMGLYDRVMIKDNHVALWTRGHGKSLADAIAEARARYPGLEVEVEVDDPADLPSALDGKPDWILLDNMAPAVLRACAEQCSGICRTEASGCVSLDTIDAVVRSGVDAVSIGALTHSAPAADLSLEMLP